MKEGKEGCVMRESIDQDKEKRERIRREKRVSTALLWSKADARESRETHFLSLENGRAPQCIGNNIREYNGRD
jgi:hypothetical protein